LKTTKERVFGKRPNLTINALDWMNDEDVLAVTTRGQFNRNQRGGDYNCNLNTNSQNQSISNPSRNFGNPRNT